jgi:predicted ATPase
MTVIQAAVSAAGDGQGTVILIEGRAGFGKTRLIGEARRLAELEGMAVGTGRSDIEDTAVPLSTLIAACFGGATPLLDRAGLSFGHAASIDRYWLLLELETLLERAALQRPLLICLDDLQWADTGSVDALRTLPERLAGVPIVWVIAYRPGLGSALLKRSNAELEETARWH